MDLPRPWVIRECEKYPGRCFYLNLETNEASWIRPVSYPGNKITWPPIVYVLFILIKHNQSDDITSWKGTPVVRSREDAKAKAKNIIKDIVMGKRKFEDVAKEESDDPSHSSSGVVGWIKKGQFGQQFDDMAWELKTGEMSPPTDTPAGIYLILRRG